MLKSVPFALSDGWVFEVIQSLHVHIVMIPSLSKLMFSISLYRTPKAVLREAGGGRYPFGLFVLKGQHLMFPLVLFGDLSLPPNQLM